MIVGLINGWFRAKQYRTGVIMGRTVAGRQPASAGSGGVEAERNRQISALATGKEGRIERAADRTGSSRRPGGGLTGQRTDRAADRPGHRRASRQRASRHRPAMRPLTSSGECRLGGYSAADQ